jgi:hypothetical protein
VCHFYSQEDDVLDFASYSEDFFGDGDFDPESKSEIKEDAKTGITGLVETETKMGMTQAEIKAESEVTDVGEEAKISSIKQTEAKSADETEIWASSGAEEVTNALDTDAMGMGEEEIKREDETDVEGVGEAEVMDVVETEVMGMGEMEIRDIGDAGEATDELDVNVMGMGEEEIKREGERDVVGVGEAEITDVVETEVMGMGEMEIRDIGDAGEATDVFDTKTTDMSEEEVKREGETTGEAEITDVVEVMGMDVDEAAVTVNETGVVANMDQADITEIYGETEVTGVDEIEVSKGEKDLTSTGDETNAVSVEETGGKSKTDAEKIVVSTHAYTHARTCIRCCVGFCFPSTHTCVRCVFLFFLNCCWF